MAIPQGNAILYLNGNFQAQVALDSNGKAQIPLSWLQGLAGQTVPWYVKYQPTDFHNGTQTATQNETFNPANNPNVTATASIDINPLSQGQTATVSVTVSES